MARHADVQKCDDFKKCDAAEPSKNVSVCIDQKSNRTIIPFCQDTIMLDLTVKLTALVTLLALASVILFPG